MARIAIHGFGRIARSLMRAALKHDLFVPVSLSDIRDVPTLAALFEVDSNYGRWPEPISTRDSRLVVGGREIPYFDSTKALPDWKTLGVDLVIDCTGRATTRAGAQAHLDVGATRVLVSAPSKKREDCNAVLLPRFLHLDDHVGALEHVLGIAHDLGADRPVIIVGAADSRTRLGFDENFVAMGDELTNAVGGQSDPILENLDLLGNTDEHFGFLQLL